MVKKKVAKKALILLCLSLMLALFLVGCGRTVSLNPKPSGLAVAEISFDLKRMGGYSSDQFAIWVEDKDGNYIKTLFVTNFSGNGGGWSFRPDSLATWLERADVGNMSETEIDAISGATPKSGTIVYYWDCKDASGKLLSGDYRVLVQGTLYNEKLVLYTAQITIGATENKVTPTAEYINNPTSAEKEMLTNVKVTYRPAK